MGSIGVRVGVVGAGAGPTDLATHRSTDPCVFALCALSKGMPLIGGAVDWMIDAFPGVIMVGAGKGERVDAEKLCREACRNPQLRAAMVAFYIARLMRAKADGYTEVYHLRQP